MAAGNACSIRQIALDYVLHAASGVVEGHRQDLWIVAKEVATLIERNGVGKGPPQIRFPDAPRSDQVMHNSQMQLALDKDVARQKQVRVLSYGSGQGVLDGDDGNGHISGFEMIKNFNRPSAWKQCAAGHNSPRSFVTERTGFALDCNFHPETLAGE
jgi:hypothetical protein